MPFDSSTGIYYQLSGEGANLLLGFPYFASFDEIMPDAIAGTSTRMVEGLADRYRVLTLDYPSIGRSRDVPVAELSARRVAADTLSVADAAGFDRFIYCGYSWGASVGLQLARHSDRLEALAIGAWSPLGADYAAMLRAALEQVDDPPPEVQVVLREPGQYAQWVSYYRSLQDYDERPVLDALYARGTPCLAFVGAGGDTTAGSEAVRNASILRKAQQALEVLGWQVEFLPHAGHGVGLEPERVLPLLRKFLDPLFAAERPL